MRAARAWDPRMGGCHAARVLPGRMRRLAAALARTRTRVSFLPAVSVLPDPSGFFVKSSFPGPGVEYEASCSHLLKKSPGTGQEYLLGLAKVSG